MPELHSISRGLESIYGCKDRVCVVRVPKDTIGLKKAHVFFQGVIKNKCMGLKGETLEVYKEEINVGSYTLYKHGEDMCKSSERTKEAKLPIKFQKCAF